MTTSELVKALIADNSLADEFDKLDLWKKFDSFDWSDLLSAQPQFADKCAEYKVWEKLNSWDWYNLLPSQPQFTEKAKEFEGGWVGLLQIKPELANECECWEE